MSKTTVAYTPVDEIPQILSRLRAGFRSGKLRPIEYRQNQLLQLAYLFEENITPFEEAFAADLGRHRFEATFLELNGTIGECVEAHKKVKTWAAPEGVAFNPMFSPMRPKIYKEAKGVALIIGPFNYPILCSIGIMAGAIAAGCACVVKMSELTPNISGLVAELFPKYMDPELFHIVNGGIPETTKLLELQWDHIVFTGSGNVGRIVAAAAAKHLTPVTLELGGQCPTFVDPKIDLDFAARRILWGKTINVGQTCLAPNHIFVPEEAQDALAAAFARVYDEFYPDGAAQSTSVSRIVADTHFQRLQGLLEKTNGHIVRGGQTDASQRFLAPTVVRDVKLDDPLMTAELFGPILPIVPVKNLQDAIDYTNSKDHPLALYVFSDDAELKKHIIDSTQSGGVGVNEVCVHLAVPGLPFGGTGQSGYGQHTGKFSFDTFTHLRSSIDSPHFLDWFFSFRFPPYTDAKFKQSLASKPKIPLPRPGPGVAPVTTQGLLSRVRLARPALISLGILIFALTLRQSLGYGSGLEHIFSRLPWNKRV